MYTDDDLSYDDDGTYDHHDPGTHAAAAFGVGYGLYRYAQDKQTGELRRIAADAVHDLRQEMRATPTVTTTTSTPSQPVTVNVNVASGEREIPYVGAPVEGKLIPGEWDDYIGQDPLKRQLAVYVSEAKRNKTRLPHILLNSGNPGVGKTTMARLLAKTMGVQIAEVVPPFDIYTLAEAGEQLDDGDILFIDELHLLGRQQEMLLKPLEDHVVHLHDGRVVEWADITIVGATTEGNRMLDTILDRFKVKPYFQRYSVPELAEIALIFADKHHATDVCDDELLMAIGAAARKTPRICEEMVLAQRALSTHLQRAATPKELLEFLEVQPDGLSRLHIQYLTGLRQFFPRMVRNLDGSETVQYVAGLAALRTLMRETEKGLPKIENFLIERGLVDRTPQGRRLSVQGVARAEDFIARGMGVADAAA